MRLIKYQLSTTTIIFSTFTGHTIIYLYLLAVLKPTKRNIYPWVLSLPTILLICVPTTTFINTIIKAEFASLTIILMAIYSLTSKPINPNKFKPVILLNMLTLLLLLLGYLTTIQYELDIVDSTTTKYLGSVIYVYWIFKYHTMSVVVVKDWMYLLTDVKFVITFIILQQIIIPVLVLTNNVVLIQTTGVEITILTLGTALAMSKVFTSTNVRTLALLTTTLSTIVMALILI